MKIVTLPFIPLPPDARDAYELAEEQNITPEAAAALQRGRDWEFVGYNDFGQPAYVPVAHLDSQKEENMIAQSRVIVATHTHTHPVWRAWSQAVAYAESLPVGTPVEVKAWETADEAWKRWQEELAAPQDAPSYRGK